MNREKIPNDKSKNVFKIPLQGRTRKFSELSNKVLGCAIEVHKILGPGLLESTYEKCLAREFELNGIEFNQQLQLDVLYKGTKIDCGYRIDMLVEDEIIIELKSVAKMEPIFEAQILTYMKLAKKKQGFLINFNVTKLKDGIKSLIL